MIFFQIPHSKHSSTHLFILATAGMRLLSDDKQRSILRHLRQGLKTNKFSFKKLDCISTLENVFVINGLIFGNEIVFCVQGIVKNYNFQFPESNLVSQNQLSIILVLLL
jgi:hypothetical protein